MLAAERRRPAGSSRPKTAGTMPPGFIGQTDPELADNWRACHGGVVTLDGRGGERGAGRPDPRGAATLLRGAARTRWSAAARVIVLYGADVRRPFGVSSPFNARRSSRRARPRAPSRLGVLFATGNRDPPDLRTPVRAGRGPHGRRFAPSLVICTAVAALVAPRPAAGGRLLDAADDQASSRPPRWRPSRTLSPMPSDLAPRPAPAGAGSAVPVSSTDGPRGNGLGGLSIAGTLLIGQVVSAWGAPPRSSSRTPRCSSSRPGAGMLLPEPRPLRTV